MTKALKTRQVCLFFIFFLPVIKFFMMPSIIAKEAKQDIWICLIINCFIDLITVAVALYALKDENGDFFCALEKHFGKPVGKTFMILYAVFFLLKTLLPVNEQKDYVEYTLYMTTPNLLTFLPVFAVIFYISLQKLRVWGRLSDGVAIIALLGYFMLFALSISNANFNELKPVGISGIKGVVTGAFNSQTWFNDGVYFLFFSGEYLKSKKHGLKILLSCLISCTIVIFFGMIFYGTFSSIAYRQRFALTEISKYTTVITNIGRFDYIALFSLLFTSVFSLALPFYFAVNLIQRCFNLKKPFWISLVICLIGALFNVFTEKYFVTVENFIINVAGWYFLALGSVVPIIVCLIIKWRTNNENERA